MTQRLRNFLQALIFFQIRQGCNKCYLHCLLMAGERRKPFKAFLPTTTFLLRALLSAIVAFVSTLFPDSQNIKSITGLSSTPNALRTFFDQRILLFLRRPSSSANFLSIEVLQAPVSNFAGTNNFFPWESFILIFSKVLTIFTTSSCLTLSENGDAKRALAIFIPWSISLTVSSSTLSSLFLKPAILASCIERP